MILIHPPGGMVVYPKPEGVATVTCWGFASGSGFDLRIDRAKRPAQNDGGTRDPLG